MSSSRLNSRTVRVNVPMLALPVRTRAEPIEGPLATACQLGRVRNAGVVNILNLRKQRVLSDDSSVKVSQDVLSRVTEEADRGQHVSPLVGLLDVVLCLGRLVHVDGFLQRYIVLLGVLVAIDVAIAHGHAVGDAAILNGLHGRLAMVG